MDFALRSCSWRGHATFAPDEPELQARLHVTTPAGEAWRCLRCEGFIVGSPRSRGPADEAPEVPRGRLLRDRFIMRVLAIERVLRGIVFALLAVGVFKVRGSRARFQESFQSELPLIRPLAQQIGWNMDDSKILRAIDSAFHLSPRALLLIAIGLIAYAAVELIEAVGLWLVQRWGEYFAVIATSAFLPLEVFELTEKVTVVKALALTVNLVAVVWLLWSKRLFGLNGGGTAYHAEHGAESLLTVERAAVMPETEWAAVTTD